MKTDTGEVPKAPLHNRDGLRVIVNEHERATAFLGRYAGGAAAGEEIEHRIAGIGGSPNNAPQYAERLLRGVAGAFFAICRDDGVPPDICGELGPALLSPAQLDATIGRKANLAKSTQI